MSLTQPWLLPEGIDEVMPEQASQLEALRRKLIDNMQSWGYKLVVPPLVEYLDSLLTGTAKSLDIQTFKLTDQMSGRMLGIRADITPQVARIAAHKLRDDRPIQRLCYIGNVLQTLPQNQAGSRNPIQLGAEIYGHSGPESDVEILQLMIDVLSVTGYDSDILLDIGHVGIYRSLAQHAGLNQEQEQALFAVLQRKANAEITELLHSYSLSDDNRAMLLALAELNGGKEVLDKARQIFSHADDTVKAALITIQEVADMLQQRIPTVALHFDLAELRGYDYHTGLVFSAYQAGSSRALAMGGRYDDIGEAFGHAQPATGFSIDIKSLIADKPFSDSQETVILTDWTGETEQQKMIKQLRCAGETVIYKLSDSEKATKHLIKQNGHWQVVETGT